MYEHEFTQARIIYTMCKGREKEIEPNNNYNGNKTTYDGDTTATMAKNKKRMIQDKMKNEQAGKRIC